MRIYRYNRSMHKVALMGIPLDYNSSHIRGPALAPQKIRDALNSGSMNWCAESGLDLKKDLSWTDLGDIECSDEILAFQKIEAMITHQVQNDLKVLTLGGDHSITYPILSAYGRFYPNLTILHFDAHPDLYDELDGNPFSHACPFARIMEEELATRLIQVGIRTINPHQAEQIERFKVEVIEMQDWQNGFDIEASLEIEGPVYLSFDIDALDPSCAPGVSHYEPGGFMVREVIRVIQNLSCEIVGADIVEYNPNQDINDMTAFVAAKLFKEILAKML